MSTEPIAVVAHGYRFTKGRRFPYVQVGDGIEAKIVKHHEHSTDPFVRGVAEATRIYWPQAYFAISDYCPDGSRKDGGPKVVLLPDMSVLVDGIPMRAIFTQGTRMHPSELSIDYCRGWWAGYLRIRIEDVELAQGL